ncbi:MAG: tetratricopeptide repeat protein [Pseudomonadota bacterium]
MPAGGAGGALGPDPHALDWRRLHPHEGTRPFVEALKRAITAEISPHYVLVDARTGLSDLGGLSTHLIADQVVLVFNLSRDCLDGTVGAFLSLRAAVAAQERALIYTLLAASVPPGSDSLVQTRLVEAAERMKPATAFGRRVLRVDYDPSMALAEALAVHDPERFRAAAASYEALRERLQRDNPREVFTALEQARALRTQGRLQDALEDLQAVTRAHPDNADGHEALGGMLLEAGRAAEAAVAFREAVQLAPAFPLFHRRLGEALLQAGDAEGARDALAAALARGERSYPLHIARVRAFDALREHADALTARRDALAILLGEPPDEPGGGLGLAREEFVALMAQAAPFAGFEAGEFWDLLFGSVAMGLAEKRRKARALIAGRLSASRLQELTRLLQEEVARFDAVFEGRWAAVRARIAASPVEPGDLAGLDQLLRGDADDARVLRAYALMDSRAPAAQVDLLRRAVVADPEDAAAWDELGNALGEAAQAATEAPARVHGLTAARDAHARAAGLRPAWNRALNNWGVTLSDLAAEHAGPERLALLRQACERYAEALHHKPDEHEALNNWGIALAALAAEHAGPERITLLRQACDRYAEALRHEPGDHKALNNRAIALIHLYHELPPPEATSCLTEARGHCLAANRIVPGRANYNLACAESLLGEHDAAEAHLLADLAADPSTVAQALADADFAPLFEARPALRARLEARPTGEG